MRASYPTVAVVVGGVKYDVHLRILPGRAPSHAGADSPRYMDPGASPRATVIRILKDGVVVQDAVTNDLHWSVRQQVVSESLRLAASGLVHSGAVKVPASTAAPASTDGEDLR